MAWTANITNVVKNNDTVSLTILFTDGVKSFYETYKTSGVPNNDLVKQFVLKRITDIEAVEAATIATGLIEVVPEVIDNDLIQLKKDISKIDIVLKLIQIKAIEVTDQKVVNFTNRIKNKLAQYWDVI